MPTPAIIKKRDHAVLRHRRAGARMSELLQAGVDRSDPRLDEAIEIFSRSWAEIQAIDARMRDEGIRDKLPRICKPRGKALWSDCYSRHAVGT